MKGFTDVVERDVGWKDAVGKIWDDGVGVIRGFWNPCWMGSDVRVCDEVVRVGFGYRDVLVVISTEYVEFIDFGL